MAIDFPKNPVSDEKHVDYNGVTWYYVVKSWLGTEVKYTPPVIVVETDFITTWTTSFGNTQISLPLRNGYTYAFDVDWGDASPVDTITSWNQAEAKHTYTDAGTYTVKITGTCEAWLFPDPFSGGTPEYLIHVNNLGDCGWVTFNSMFLSCTNLETFTVGDAVTSQITDWNSMFSNCGALISVNFTGINTTGATTFELMFNQCGLLTAIDTSAFSTPALLNMKEMFRNTGVLLLDLTSFDVSNVTTAQLCFDQSSDLVSIDFTGWVTSSLENINSMLGDCTSLVNANIDVFDVSGVTDAGFICFGSDLWADSDYDDTLISWAAQSVVSALTVNFGNAKYTATASRNTLTNAPNNWIIVDGGAA